MQYTFGQACAKLRTSTHAYGATDVKESINDAIQALAGMSGWECLRRVVRIFSASPLFALPQGCAGLVRACVAGRPTTIRGQDFEFLPSGPGDIHRPIPFGFAPVPNANIIDRGVHSYMYHPAPGFRLYAETSDESLPPVHVKYRSGDYFYDEDLVPTLRGGSDAKSLSSAEHLVEEIVSVAIDPCAASDGEDTADYITLYATFDEGEHGMRVGVYNPDVAAPSFRHYEVQNAGGACPCLCQPHGSVEILAEVRIDPMPLVRPTDVLPFDSLEPVEWMVQSRWMTRAGEVDAAQKLHALAANWLKAREVTYDTAQTAVIQNCVFSMSPGEVSMEAVNI